MIREGPRILLGLVALAGIAAFVFSRLHVTTDITHFLPAGESSRELELARRFAADERSRAMILWIEVPADADAARVSREVEEALRADPVVREEIATLEGAPAEGLEEASWEIYGPPRLAFTASDAAAARALTSDEGLRAAVDDLKRRLGSPVAGLISRIAPQDPFLAFAKRMAQLEGAAGTLALVDGRFVGADGRGAALFLTTRNSASDSLAQRPFLASLKAAFEDVDRRYGGQLELRCTGLNRHAIAAEDEIRSDIERISTISTVALVAVFLLLFASLRLPLSWVPVLGSGFVAGSAACLLVHGQVHGLTLAFGAALIGVGIDYAVHFYCHQALAPERDGPRATMRRIFPALALGCATTVLGFLVLLVAAFEGLREMALFSAVGLMAALLASWLFLPGLVGRIGPTRTCAAIARALDRFTSPRSGRRAWFAVPIGAACVLLLFGLPQVRWNDRLSSLNRLDPALHAEDELVLERVLPMERRRFVVAWGRDEESALAANDRVAEELAAASREHEIEGWRSAAQLLPSAARQREVADVLRGDRTLWPRLESTLAAAGFVPERFAPFRAALAEPEPPPLDARALEGTPLESLVRPFRVTLDDGSAAMLTFVRGVRDEPAFRRRLAHLSGVFLLDVQAVLDRTFAAYRQRMASLLAWGIVGVGALVALRYRRPRGILMALVPALLGAAATVALLGLLGIELTFLSLVALLMVVSMGVDYGIFLAEDDAHPEARRATRVGVIVDGLTTILGLGLLAFSSQPSLFSIGATAGIGVSLCLVLALCWGALFAMRERPC